jgi:multidrug transporter EmrE-like cation transporter
MKAKTWIQIALAVTTGIGGLSSLLLGFYILGGSPGPFFIGGLGLLMICGMLISSLRRSPK